MSAVNPGMDADVFEQFIEQLQRYVRQRLIPVERETIESDEISPEIVQEMRDMGLVGLTMPEEHSGSGMNISQYARTVNAIGYAMPAFRSLISINIGVFCSALKNGGTQAQKATWLPQVAAGDIAAFGLTEPGWGSDSAGMQTTAVETDQGWLLNGTKRYITNAPFAKVALIMARTSKTNLPKNAHVCSFIVPMDTPGVTIGKSVVQVTLPSMMLRVFIAMFASTAFMRARCRSSSFRSQSTCSVNSTTPVHWSELCTTCSPAYL